MQTHKHQFIILKNEDPYDHQLWMRACDNHANQVDYHVVDLTCSGWLEEIRSLPCDMLLAKPGSKTTAYKQLYDERLQILVNELGYSCFPSLKEILIYENKRFLAYWLKANQIPHPPTYIFYHRREAERFLETADFPLVAKLNIGASGNGIEILHNPQEARKYQEQMFSGGRSSVAGPRWNKGHLWQRGWNKIRHPVELANRIKTYRNIAADVQRNFLLFQQYIPHAYEWRVVRIGDSFFAHKKMLKKEKASGSLVKGYENPPFSLLDFVKELTDQMGFYSQAVDLFEPKEGQYLVNEMQCIFGQSDSYQMLVDKQPGRYVFRDNHWHFEEGNFNGNESYDLRVKWLISELNKTSL